MRRANLESTEYGARVVAQRVLHVTLSAGDDLRTDEAARQLSTELRDFSEVQTISRPGDGSAPPGARGGELVAVGGLIVTVLGQPEALGAVVKYVVDRIWRRGGSVQVEVDGQVLRVENATAAQRDAIVDAFVRKVLDRDS
jgi:hypothetical protein